MYHLTQLGFSRVFPPFSNTHGPMKSLHGSMVVNLHDLFKVSGEFHGSMVWIFKLFGKLVSFTGTRAMAPGPA